MKHRKSIWLGAITVLITLAIAAAVPALRKNSPMFNWLFSPADMYTPLSVSAINFSEEGQSHQINFENRYPGLHWFAVQVETPVAVDAAYEGEFILRLEVSKKGTPVLSQLIEGPGSGYRSGKSGVILHRYNVPDDLPLREALNAEITVVRADELFESKHGPLKIVVKKLSDE